MRIRLAEVADAEAIRTIYNVEVLDSTNTFDMVPRTRAEQEAWILEHSGVHPALVAIEAHDAGVDGTVGANGEVVLGFGSLSAFHERSGYSATAENSVYVDRSPPRRGGREGAAGGAPGPGLGPRLPLGHRPHRRAQRDLHRPAQGGRFRAGRRGAGGRSQAPPVARRGRAAAPAVSTGPATASATRVRTREPRSGRGARGARAAVSGRSATRSSSSRAGRWPPPTAP